MTSYEQFFKRINSLDSGERATLRREVGCSIRSAHGKAITTFYKCMTSSENKSREECFFAIACLRCLWESGDEKGLPLEQIISNLICSEDISDSTKHRVELLLDTEFDDDGYMILKLARLVKLVRQKTDRIMIDFSELLNDLIYWNSESQFVQRKWAKTIFSSKQKTEE